MCLAVPVLLIASISDPALGDSGGAGFHIWLDWLLRLEREDN